MRDVCGCHVRPSCAQITPFGSWALLDLLDEMSEDLSKASVPSLQICWDHVLLGGFTYTSGFTGSFENLRIASATGLLCCLVALCHRQGVAVYSRQSCSFPRLSLPAGSPNYQEIRHTHIQISQPIGSVFRVMQLIT